jgi:hypothetical protein
MVDQPVPVTKLPSKTVDLSSAAFGGVFSFADIEDIRKRTQLLAFLSPSPIRSDFLFIPLYAYAVLLLIPWALVVVLVHEIWDGHNVWAYHGKMVAYGSA